MKNKLTTSSEAVQVYSLKERLLGVENMIIFSVKQLPKSFSLRER